MSEPGSRDEAHPSRGAIIGAGRVGGTFGFALTMSGLASELVIVDRDRDRAEGEAMDLVDAVPFSRPVRIWAGSTADCAGAAITLIAAGTAQRPGETRRELVQRNVAILADIVPELARVNPDGILLLATNPVDTLAQEAQRLSGLPPGRVIGSGTILDTGRFRARLAAHFEVDPRSVHAFIVGEHGDSEVPIWSSANIAGMRLAEFCASVGMPYDRSQLDAIFTETRDAAYHIIDRKGATYYGIAAGLLRIVEAILRDQKTILPVSTLVRDYEGIDDVYLSLPAVIGRNGVERILRPELAPEEADALRASASVLRELLDSLEPTRAS